MILDPLYFGGLAGLFVGFFFMMRAARSFDRYVVEDRILVSRAATAVSMAFATGIVAFENDWVGSLANIAVTAILCFVFLALCTRRGETITSS
jgi:hypothetical protein